MRLPAPMPSLVSLSQELAYQESPCFLREAQRPHLGQHCSRNSQKASGGTMEPGKSSCMHLYKHLQGGTAWVKPRSSRKRFSCQHRESPLSASRHNTSGIPPVLGELVIVQETEGGSKVHFTILLPPGAHPIVRVRSCFPIFCQVFSAVYVKEKIKISTTHMTLVAPWILSNTVYI